MKPSGWQLLEEEHGSLDRGRVVAVANQKGGVGKTTTAVNLGAGLALRGHRILVLDIDPQGNATTGLGIDSRSLKRSTYDLILGASALEDVVKATAIAGLDCAPSSADLAGAEVELVGVQGRAGRLAEGLRGVEDLYELVLVDCPPSLGLLTLNGLAAARALIVPVQCEYYALEGLGQLLGTAERVRRSVNPELRVAGFLLTMFDARTKLAGQVADEVRRHFGDRVFGTVIPRSVRLSEAPSFGEPVLTLDPSARGSVAYRFLASEVEAHFGLDVHPPPPPGPPGPVEGAGPAAEPALREAEPGPGAVPGPGGRGYGTTTAEPPGLDHAWPRRPPW
jgi:chromosome partitioning protein